ncbi:MULTISPECIES: ImmA/IrrE family metallo-endopeptidase [Pectinatus]|uniref:Zn-dependent peptidase ImmA (M78 family) n=1 Tax=Pectinatus haikarae TaxID=349096 RepID=A0ABT9Y8G5_9FIRM|nr:MULTISPECIES: ImmA/IrrE family metallo-endopeptidase [Pectinatus]MDQ0204107.1 Zn-dependent peptidase ImmA (M78 family) [Pectinatus haikarae]
MNIKDEVVKLINKYDTNNPFLIAKELKIIVMFAPLGNTLGHHLYDSRFDVIHINEKLKEEMRTFVCAHELGHAILHKGVSTNFLRYHSFFSTARIERQAHTFAVEMILPDKYLKENSDFGLYQLAEMHGIPKNLIDLKSH